MTKQHDDIQETLDQLSVLAPSERAKSTAAPLMLARIKQQIDQAEAEKRPSVWSTLASALFAPSRRWAVTAVLLVALFAVGLSNPTLRAAASDFLGQFRVQKFAAISISPEQLAVLEQVAESGLTPGTLQFVEEPGAGTAVNTVREASIQTGMSVQTLPTLGNAETIYLTDGGSAIFTVDLESSRQILELVDLDPALLPNELANSDIRIFIYDGVMQQWADGTTLMQTTSPIVEYPQGIDPAVLGQAFLQLLGLSEAEATRLAAQIDWTSTLVLPIPTDVGTFQEVTVQGVSGLSLSTLNGETALLWQKDDVLFMLTGDGGMAQLVTLAEELE